jgi:hypothetical protein
MLQISDLIPESGPDPVRIDAHGMLHVAVDDDRVRALCGSVDPLGRGSPPETPHETER